MLTDFFMTTPLLASLVVTLILSAIIALSLHFYARKWVFHILLGASFLQLGLLIAHVMAVSPLEEKRDAFGRDLVASATFPQVVAEGMQLVAMSWDGQTLDHTYEVASLALIPNQQTIEQLTCSGSVRVEALALGIILRQSYVSNHRSPVVYDVSLLDCYD